jgi:serine/threonine protein phosphatase PrpC
MRRVDHCGWKITGATVASRAHRKGRVPNQDAWAITSTKNWALAVVCDGLGSKPESAFGAQQACRAAIDAARIWGPSGCQDFNGLLRLLEMSWNVRVHAVGADKAGSTCLLAFWRSDGELYLAQLGDGVAAVAAPGIAPTMTSSGKGEFANETHSLNSQYDREAWSTLRFTGLPENSTFLLATDGVADHLDFSRWNEICNLLLGTLEANSNGPPPSLRRQLSGLPGGDDRTLLCGWRLSH